MNSSSVFFSLAVAAFVFIFIGMMKRMAKEQREENALWLNFWITLEREHGFAATQKYIGVDKNTGFAVDEGKKTACLITRRSSLYLPYSPKVYIVQYDDFLSVELFEDGTSLGVTKTSRLNQAGGLVVGGLLLGGGGALIGGLTSKKITSNIEKINRLELRIIINDMKRPTHDVCFLNQVTEKGGATFASSMHQARRFHGLITALIRQADDEKMTLQSSLIAAARTSSIAEELNKLAALRDAGELTLEEFHKLKDKLLTAQ